MTTADPPDFDRLELDEDGELVGGRVQGARHAGDAFARARLVDVELVRCDLAGCDGLRGVGALRGATIGVDQLFGLAPGPAAAVGVRVLAEED